MNKTTPPNTHQPVRAAGSAFFGTAIEFYDFYIYSTAAALVLADLFFPSHDPILGLMASYASLAVGFIARPFSGVVFGHLGDKMGRKKLLLFTMTLMGSATAAIGLLPTYATIGMWAPVLLICLRLLQGVSVGGEWGGAVLMAAEHAPVGRKTFFASFAQLGSPAGLLMSILAFRMISTLPKEDFMSWGWRLPFLASGVFMMVGLLIRSGVNESPDFEKVRANENTAKYPVIEVFKSHWKHILSAAAAVTIGIAGFWVTSTFMITYATTYQKLPKTMILDCLFIVTCFQFISQPISALIAERIGTERFLKIMASLALVTPYPMFLLVNTHQMGAMVAGISVTVVVMSGLYAVMAGYMSGAFPARVRYSGISIAYQMCATLGGGTAPIICLYLTDHFASSLTPDTLWLPVALFYSMLSLISLLGVLGLSRLRHAERDTPASQPSSLSNAA